MSCSHLTKSAGDNLWAKPGNGYQTISSELDEIQKVLQQTPVEEYKQPKFREVSLEECCEYDIVDLVVRRLEEMFSFVSPVDTGEILVYDPYMHIWRNADPTIEYAYIWFANEAKKTAIQAMREKKIYFHEGEDPTTEIKPWHKAGDEGNRQRKNCRDKVYKKISKETVNAIKLIISATHQINREELNRFNYRLIPLINGVYDVYTQKLLPYHPKFYFTYRLNAEYDPNADMGAIYDFITDVVPDENEREALLEILGTCLLPGLNFQKILVCVGKGANGKTTLLNVIKALFGEKYVTGFPLNELLKNSFMQSELRYSLLNISDDVPSEPIQNTGIFKTLIGGGTLTADVKYHNPATFQVKTKFIMSVNVMPHTTDDTYAFFRRLLLVTFPKVIPDNKQDPYLSLKLSTAQNLNGLFLIMLAYLFRVLRENRIVHTISIDEIQQRYYFLSNPMLRYVEECIVPSENNEIPKEDLFAHYLSFCQKNNLPTPTFFSFVRNFPHAVYQVHHITVSGDRKRVIDGKRVYVFSGINISENDGKNKEGTNTANKQQTTLDSINAPSPNNNSQTPPELFKEILEKHGDALMEQLKQLTEEFMKKVLPPECHADIPELTKDINTANIIKDNDDSSA